MKNKVLSLAVTISPGFYRLLVILMVNKFYSQNIASGVINNYVLATGICVFSGLGASICYMKNIGGCLDLFKRKVLFTSHLFISVILSILFYIIYSLITVNFSITLLLMIISLSWYQLYRHYFLSVKNFNYLLLSDVLLLILTVLIGYFYIELSLILSNIIFGFVFILYNLPLILKVDKTKFIEDILLSIKLGYTNLVSSGVMYILPSLLLTFSNESTVAVISMIITIAGVVFVIPRALINNNIQKIAKDARDGIVDDVFYRGFNKKLYLVCSFMFPISIIISYIYLALNGVINDFSLLPLFLIIFTLNLMLTIGQFSLMDSMLIFFLNKEKVAIILNSIVFSLVGFMYFLFSFYKFSGEHYQLICLIFVIMSFCYLIRFFIMKKYIVRFGNENG